MILLATSASKAAFRAGARNVVLVSAEFATWVSIPRSTKRYCCAAVADAKSAQRPLSESTSLTATTTTNQAKLEGFCVRRVTRRSVWPEKAKRYWVG